MENILHVIVNYLFKALFATGSQLFVLLGPLLFLSFLMNYIAKLNENLSYKVFGRTIYLYGFGWLGTAVHEIGHAIFAVLFRHKITEMVLFSPNAETGSLGHVNHSYDKKSIYQNIGNFFIGIGPILFGSCTLFIITYSLYQFNIANISVVFNTESLLHFSLFKTFVTQVGGSIYHYYDFVLFGQKSTWWRILLLLFCLYSIGSSITLSPADTKGATKGFCFFVIILLLFNIMTIWIGNFTEILFLKLSSYFSILYFLIILSIFVNLFFIIVLILLHFLKSMIVGNS